MTAPAPMTWRALSSDGEAGSTSSTAAHDPAPPDDPAVEEMLRGSKGRREQWFGVPELVVLTSVMLFHPDRSGEFVATADVLADDEVDALVAELTGALSLLTDHTFEQFAAVRRELPPAGTLTRVIRRNQIVVGRYRGIRHQAGVLGLSGRAVRSDGGITGAAVLLDDEYDRTESGRVLLRTHELGHALGYNHVQSRESIMNPRIGPETTDFDRQTAAIAYGGSGYRR